MLPKVKSSSPSLSAVGVVAVHNRGLLLVAFVLRIAEEVRIFSLGATGREDEEVLRERKGWYSITRLSAGRIVWELSVEE